MSNEQDEILNIMKKAAIKSKSLINLDAEDVASALKGCKNTDFYKFLAVRLDSNLDKIFSDGRKAKGAVVLIFGGMDITIRESQAIIEAFAERMNPNAKIVWTASANKRQSGIEVSCVVGR